MNTETTERTRVPPVTGNTYQLQGEPAKRTDVMDLLPELDAGVYAQQVSVALSEAALATLQTGRKAKVVLTFTLKQIGESSTLMLDHALNVENPTPKGKRTESRTTATPLHVTRAGRMTLYPENQQPLFDELQPR